MWAYKSHVDGPIYREIYLDTNSFGIAEFGTMNYW